MTRTLLSGEDKDVAKSTRQPDWTSPMLATLTEDYFSDKDWLFERKLDGERVMAFRRGKNIRLMSRNRKELNDTYPEIIDAIGEQDTPEFIADGEVVAFEGKITSFSRLQQRMQVRRADKARRSGVAVYYYLFDLPHVEGYDITALPLRRRKALLRRLFVFHDPLRFMTHRNEKGEEYHEEACQKSWEGVIAKKADSTYVHSRSREWLKFKCVNEQEFVVTGYTDPKGTRVGLGALLIGYYEGDNLLYAGQVGTGFDNETLQRLKARLSKIERDEPSTQPNGLPRKGVHWVEPQLVAQVGFTEWTKDGKLRHPRYLGLRRDKKPKDVVRERPS